MKKVTIPSKYEQEDDLNAVAAHNEERRLLSQSNVSSVVDVNLDEEEIKTKLHLPIHGT